LPICIESLPTHFSDLSYIKILITSASNNKALVKQFLKLHPKNYCLTNALIYAMISGSYNGLDFINYYFLKGGDKLWN